MILCSQAEPRLLRLPRLFFLSATVKIIDSARLHSPLAQLGNAPLELFGRVAERHGNAKCALVPFYGGDAGGGGGRVFIFQFAAAKLLFADQIEQTFLPRRSGFAARGRFYGLDGERRRGKKIERERRVSQINWVVKQKIG